MHRKDLTNHCSRVLPVGTKLRIPIRFLAWLAAAAACMSATGQAAVRAAPAGVRFNSPGVLDLAERSQHISGGHAVPAVELAAADAEAIFAAPAQAEMTGLVFSDEIFGCKKPSHRCSLEHERALVAASSGSVKRDGKRLIVTPASGTTLEFVDWIEPTTKTADGDSEEHWYLGRMPGSGYLRVEVDFGQDSPGNFLINPQSGKIAFVHNGDDIAAPSPDGRLLVTFNALNAPLSIRVAALDESGPRLLLQCEVPDDGRKLTPLFKGWHDIGSFDLVLELGEQRKAMPRLALRAQQDSSGWRIAASDVGRLASVGLACTMK